MEDYTLIPANPVEWMKSNQDQFGILIIRYLMAIVWLSQGMSKVLFRSDNNYEDFNNFLSEVNYMAVTNPIKFIVNLLEKVIIPNIIIFTYLVILIELIIGFSYAFGIFTRLGSVIGGLMTITLWMLTLGWDEWIWTYPLIFFPHVLLFLSKSGRIIGLDRLILRKSDNSIIQLFT